ncbi:MAG: hypothetical protein K2X69_12930 [Silvanigrellaceae bacterium]|nr:hypothetical protein [Silvanigrellaceae bacterium]
MKDFEVISSYSVEQALDDGVLVKLSNLFKKEVDECGILIPVYCTRSVFEKYISLTPAAIRALNDEKGRAWDLLFMSRQALKTASKEDNIGKNFYFKFYCVVKRINPTLCTCKVICDGYSFTILEINED